MSNLGQRLTQARKARLMSQAELARQSRVSQPTISDLEAGTQAGTKKIAELAGALKVDVNWLLTGRGEMEPRGGKRGAGSGADDDKHVYVPRVRGAVLSAGPGKVSWEHEELDQAHAFLRSWMRDKSLSPERCRIIDVIGDSMSPYLQDGDVVLVSLQHREIKSGEVYALAVGNELRVKRIVRRADGGLEIRSDNPSPQYPTELIEAKGIERVKVIGKVMWRAG
jgi:phage repressor protein C with HTH and peptisase S24 domain